MIKINKWTKKSQCYIYIYIYSYLAKKYGYCLLDLDINNCDGDDNINFHRIIAFRQIKKNKILFFKDTDDMVKHSTCYDDEKDDNDNSDNDD